MVVYRPFAHPQMPEILQVLRAMQQSFDSQIHMLPMRGSFSRGIMAVSYLDCPLELTEIIRIYSEYFADHNFTFITSKIPDLKDVVNTNKCIIHLDKIGGKLLITAVIDNLLKGGAGNAVHTMNLLFGLRETTGLTHEGHRLLICHRLSRAPLPAETHHHHQAAAPSGRPLLLHAGAQQPRAHGVSAP